MEVTYGRVLATCALKTEDQSYSDIASASHTTFRYVQWCNEFAGSITSLPQLP